MRRDAARPECADAPVDLELGPGVGDVEVAHRQLTDAVERPERLILDPLHDEPLGRVGEVRAGGVDDRVVVAPPKPQGDLAGHRRPDPAHQRFAQHQRLGIEPPTFVQQPAEATAHRAVVLDRALVVDRRERRS